MRTSWITLLCIAVVWMAAPATANSGPVADAARRGDLEAVRALLTDDADVNAPLGDGMTALHWAAYRGNEPLVELLLEAGASTTAVTRLGQHTPLHVASRAAREAVVRALLASGAAPAAGRRLRADVGRRRGAAGGRGGDAGRWPVETAAERGAARGLEDMG